MKRVLQTTMVVAVAMVAIVNACGESTGPGSVPTAAAAGPDLMVSVGETVMLSVADTVATMGLEHTWTQLSGPDVTDGSGTLSGASPMVTVPGTVSTLVFELVIGDGSHESAPDTVAILVLEDAEHALFVSPDGANTNDGTPGAPLGSIQAAIDRAVADGQGADVYVAEGQYEGSLTLGDGVSVYGGYRAEVWSRDVDTYRTAIVGGTQAIVGDAVSELTVSGLVVQSADVEADASRDLRSSYGVVLRNSRGVRLTENTISAGAGGRGEEGFPGWAGQDGESGVDGGNGSCDNENAPGKGGGGGQGWPYSGGAGGGGGTGGSGQDGAWGQGPAGGAPGAGGANNSSDRAGSGSDGGIGDVGGDGSDGDHGVGGTDFGIVHQYFGYLPADGDVGR
ncbi:MAG: hypothetical protein PVH40_08370, partial [Gemmatimonadales bacterium]